LAAAAGLKARLPEGTLTWSTVSVASGRLFVGALRLFAGGWLVRSTAWRAEVRLAQLVRELLGELRSAVAQELRWDSQLRCPWAMREAPGAKRDPDRHGLNVSFGEAVGGALTADSGRRV
jgi:hypothetical protein